MLPLCLIAEESHHVIVPVEVMPTGVLMWLLSVYLEFIRFVECLHSLYRHKCTDSNEKKFIYSF